METFHTKTKLQIPLYLFKYHQFYVLFNVFCLKCNFKLNFNVCKLYAEIHYIYRIASMNLWNDWKSCFRF